MRHRTAIVTLTFGLLGLFGGALALAAGSAKPVLTPRAYAPIVERAEDPTPTPTPVPQPTPVPYRSTAAVSGLYVGSAGISTSMPIQQRDTSYEGGSEVLQDPTSPGYIAWYPRFGHPSEPGQDALFAAHVNYFGYGNGPFVYLHNGEVGGSLYVELSDGTEYAYTITSVQVIPVSELDGGGMQDVVYPDLDAHTNRVTLISCGGDFVPYANGGGAGEYTSRVVLTAERYVP
jgi:hypothetical protein